MDSGENLEACWLTSQLSTERPAVDTDNILRDKEWEGGGGPGISLGIALVLENIGFSLKEWVLPKKPLGNTGLQSSKRPPLDLWNLSGWVGASNLSEMLFGS